jgi:hypothetical protein
LPRYDVNHASENHRYPHVSMLFAMHGYYTGLLDFPGRPE